MPLAETDKATTDAETVDRVSQKDEAASKDLDGIVRLVAVGSALHQEPLPGTTWGASGRYVIERLVGTGGMGAVYEARDELLGRVVALKVLSGVDDGEREGRLRVLREARLAARVEHERIARIYDVGEHGGSLFVAMEFIRGTTLRSSMTKGREIPFYAAKLAVAIAEGLAELHAHDVIHRDLKPENVMLSEHGGVKLLDFGLARHLGKVGQSSAAAQPVDVETGAGLSGTPGYMAPERFQGRPLDPRVDVFALGVIIYELVTGTRPFACRSPSDIVNAALKRPIFDERWGIDDSPHYDGGAPRLREVTACMLSRNPEDRFADGSEALQALQYALHRDIEPHRLRTREGLEGDILWVDDEPENNAREIRRFEEIGLRVATVTSTTMAVRCLFSRDATGARTVATNAFRAVVSDMGRKEGSREGHVLLDHMRRHGDSTPFLIYASTSALGRKEETAQRGGQGCTSSERQLFDMVTSLISGLAGGPRSESQS
jgi:serine/threonine protein kinase